jgi:hypothetical protein
MKLIKVIPNIFYSDIKVGLNLFVECLGFKLVYSDAGAEQPLYIIERDNVTILLLENDEFAKKDRPSIRIDTDDIKALFDEIKKKNMDLFHPNLAEIKTQPWGLMEFALLDDAGTCVIIQQVK